MKDRMHPLAQSQEIARTHLRAQHNSLLQTLFSVLLRAGSTVALDVKCFHGAAAAPHEKAWSKMGRPVRLAAENAGFCVERAPFAPVRQAFLQKIQF
eukprot:scaffold113733_cov19-Tisochrysis_lutea.AAC.1